MPRMLAVIAAIDAALRHPSIYRLLTPEGQCGHYGYFVAKNIEQATRGNWWLHFGGYMEEQPSSKIDGPQALNAEPFCFGWVGSRKRRINSCSTHFKPYSVAVALALKIAVDAGVIRDAHGVRQHKAATGYPARIDYKAPPLEVFHKALASVEPWKPGGEPNARELAEHACLPPQAHLAKAYCRAASRLGFYYPDLLGTAYRSPMQRAARALALELGIEI